MTSIAKQELPDMSSKIGASNHQGLFRDSQEAGNPQEQGPALVLVSGAPSCEQPQD